MTYVNVCNVSYNVSYNREKYYNNLGFIFTVWNLCGRALDNPYIKILVKAEKMIIGHWGAFWCFFSGYYTSRGSVRESRGDHIKGNLPILD